MRAFGNLMNRIQEDFKPVDPAVGMGATILQYSDRHACTIVEVSQDKKRIVIQRDRATRADSNGMSDAQAYTYTANPSGVKNAVTLRKDGRWRFEGSSMRNGTVVGLGYRDEHFDFSF